MGIDATPIGISALDEALGGGLPRGSVVLIEFDTGTRIDAFITTYLATGLKRGELAYILCTEYPLRFPYQQLQVEGINVENALEKKQLIGIDAFTDAFGWGEFEPGIEYAVHDLTNSRHVHDVIRKSVLALESKDNLRGVIDSLTSIIHAARNPDEAINYVHHQMSAQKNHGNVLIYTIHRGSHSEEILGRLEHIVDGVIALYKIYHETGWKIAIQIEKMRGVDFEPVLYEYHVKNGQITLTPLEEEEEEEEEEDEEEEEEAEALEPTPESMPEPVPEPLTEPLPPPAPEYASEPLITPTPQPTPPQEPETEQPEKPEKEEENDEETSDSTSTFFF